MHSEPKLASPDINSRVDGGVLVLAPVGAEFAGDSVRELSRLVGTARSLGYTDLVLDLTGCSTTSSEGLGVVASCWSWCHEQGRGRMAVALAHANGSELVNLFDITGLTGSIGSALQPTLEDALNYVRTF